MPIKPITSPIRVPEFECQIHSNSSFLLMCTLGSCKCWIKMFGPCWEVVGRHEMSSLPDLASFQCSAPCALDGSMVPTPTFRSLLIPLAPDLFRVSRLIFDLTQPQLLWAFE